MQRRSKLNAKARGSSRIINKIRENAYKLKLIDEYDTSHIFNVKDLRTYHGEDLRTSLFFPNYKGLMQELLKQTLGIQS